MSHLARPNDEGETIRFNADNKFDIQLSEAKAHEKRLADIFDHGSIELIEMKTENFQWERTGNICIEYRQNGKPSGISVTKAELWVHKLRRGDQTICYLMFPIDRLKELCREAHRRGHWRDNAGDGGRFHVILLRLKDILK